MRSLCICLALLFGTGSVLAEAATPAEADAVAIVKEAEALVRSEGQEAALAAINDPKGPFVKGSLYVMAYDIKDAKLLAHPINPKLIGKDLLNVPDTDGKFFRKEILEVAKTKGEGWVNYSYQNPETKAVEQKTTYVRRVDDLILAAGIYRRER